jgi:hypothetical protein
MRLAEGFRLTGFLAILLCAFSGWAQSSRTSITFSRPRVETHCSAGVCATSIDPSSLPPDTRSVLVRRGVDLSHPLLLRNLGKWAGALPEPTCYTMRSYLMTRDDPHSDSTRQVGYSVCEPSSTFDVRDSIEPQR